MSRPRNTKPPDNILQAIQLKHDNPNLTLKQLEQLVGVDDTYICRQFKRYKIDWNRTQSFKQFKADIYAGEQERILKSITKDDLKDASLKDKVLSVGILHDKEEQIRNKTAIKDLASDIIERLAKDRRKTTITIEQDNIDITSNIDNNNVINVQATVE